MPLNEYLEQIRSELIELMTNDYKVKISVNIVFRSKTNPNDESNVFFDSEDTTHINEIFGQLIKKHEELTEPLKIIDFLPKSIEPIVYSFTKIVTTNTFIESPTWLNLKKCTINQQNNGNSCFQYSIIASLCYQQIGRNLESPLIKPLINNLNWKNLKQIINQLL